MSKNISLLSVILFVAGLFLTSENLTAQNNNSGNNQEVQLKVLGNCGMCEERIEKAAFSVRGVRRADWDKKEQVLTLSFRNDRTSLEAIERAIAKAGHDTEHFLADDVTYSKLHSCCLYKRDPELLKNNKVWNQQ